MLYTLVLLTLYGNGGVSSPNSFHKDVETCRRVGERIQAERHDSYAPGFTCTEALAAVPPSLVSPVPAVAAPGASGVQPPQGIPTNGGLLTPEQLRQKCSILTKEMVREMQSYGACMN